MEPPFVSEGKERILTVMIDTGGGSEDMVMRKRNPQQQMTHQIK